MPRNPHTYAGVNSPARLLGSDCTPPNPAQTQGTAGASAPHNSAQHNAKCGASGSNRVARPQASGSQKPGIWPNWHGGLLAAVVLSLAIGALLFTAVAHGKCRTKACWKRVHVARAERWLWRQYKAHPMPGCTWAGESSSPGDYSRPYSQRRYRARNSQSTAGGKFQILDQTWHAFGGPDYPGTHDAAQAPALLQERIARRVLKGQGIHAWVGC